tara:strand:- start:1679 stop:2566 length:888 start_codon:yes stop_codon:yes gene_type:complete
MNDARYLTLNLGGKWHGNYGSTFCPAHQNTRTPALSLRDGEGGRLLAYCHAGCTFQAILEALRGLGMVEGYCAYTPPDRAELAHTRATDEAEAIKREGQALRVWNEALPISGTIAETYLRARGITCDLPEVLRFHPEAWYGPSARRLPAMVALVEGCPRVAVHRTYLQLDGRGKATVAQPKMMLGATAGGAVRLVQGDGPLVVAEGIETALSVASGLLSGPATIWAALSASGIASLRLPDPEGQLKVATDGDETGRVAGTRLAERAGALGWNTSLWPAPDGCDWNDAVNGKGLKI